MTSTTGEAAARDGTPLLTRSWTSDGEPWTAALVVHGLGEHSGRYEGLGDRLAAAGIEVRAFDQRGFGASGGRRAWVDRWERYGTDVADRLAALVSETPGVPHILYGHSLGGLIALDAVVREVVRPDVLVLSAPALGDAIAPWRRTLAPILDRLVPTMSVPNGIPGSGLSRDPAVAAGVAADPLNLTRSTVRLGAAAFAAQDDLRARLRSRHRLGIPTYVLHGSADPIVPVAATESLARFPDVTRVVHPGLLHEPHHEPETDLVIDAILDWVRRTIGVHSAQLKTASGERERAESVAGPQTRGT